ncbi:MAG TPA: hypothetical protein VI997_02845 [Candidatus Thermoplasmatota archaeon]|nr:hypothetical protein [Candidatus Thermoplasmatota archaeon]
MSSAREARRTWAEERLHCGPAKAEWKGGRSGEWKTDPWGGGVLQESVPEDVRLLIDQVQALSRRVERAERAIEARSVHDETAAVAAAERALIEALRASPEIDAIEFSVERRIPYSVVAKALERLSAKGWISRE